MIKRSTVVSLALVATVALPSAAPAASCGSVSGDFNTYAQQIRASKVGCKTARRVARGYLPGGRRVPGWRYTYRGYNIKARKGSARVKFILVGTD